MPTFRPLVALAAAALLCAPALAQQPAPAAAPPMPGGVTATTNNPNLSVASVKLDNGVRASKIIGAGVMSDANEKVGTVDDLVLTDGNKVTVAIVSLRGFIGIGSKLVALPLDQLKPNGDRISLAGATKDALNAMPSFQY